MSKLVFAISFFFAFCFAYVSPVLASGEFAADYDVLYDISSQGKTIVTQHITLTNKLTHLYAKQYSILIDSDRIKNVIAQDPQGSIAPQVLRKDGKTEILVSFNDTVVGLGKKLPFTIRFEQEDIAQKNGSIWEINIPGIQEDADLGSYTVSLNVSPELGPNAYLVPPPAVGASWNREQMIHGGISAAYGEKQSFAVRLAYYLSNSTPASKIQEITLPPDTAYQQVFVRSLEPRPLTIKQDTDGNWLAQYEIPGKTDLNISAELIVSSSLTPDLKFKTELTSPERYLQATPYWNVQDARIQKLAKEYKTPRQIYDYVVQTLSYDYDRVNTNPLRKGASTALETPNNSICMEFTDVFVAIARAAGIPAREVVGYAFTTNAKLRPLSLVSDVLHAWPEYYDAEKKLWIPVDPTWAKTTNGVNYFDKLDFNHITFAIHGISSDTPYPAGFYRRPDKTTRDIEVGFSDPAEIIPSVDPLLQSSFLAPTTITAGLPSSGLLSIKNTTGWRSSPISIDITSSPPFVTLKQSIPAILPYSTTTIPFNYRVRNILTRMPGTIQAKVNEDTIVHAYFIQPLYIVLIPTLVVSGILTILATYIVWKRKHKPISKKP